MMMKRQEKIIQQDSYTSYCIAVLIFDSVPSSKYLTALFFSPEGIHILNMLVSIFISHVIYTVLMYSLRRRRVKMRKQKEK